MGVEPLTPTPAGHEVQVPWPDGDGPLLLTVRLARIDGRTAVVGLDVGQADPSRPVELNHPVLRRLQAGRIAEAARMRLAAMLAQEGTPEALDRLAGMQMPDAPAPSVPRAPAASLQRVAQLYRAALAAGGDRARRPAVYVHRALVDAGEDVTVGAVRARIHRARAAGLLDGQDAQRPPAG